MDILMETAKWDCCIELLFMHAHGCYNERWLQCGGLLFFHVTGRSQVQRITSQKPFKLGSCAGVSSDTCSIPSWTVSRLHNSFFLFQWNTQPSLHRRTSTHRVQMLWLESDLPVSHEPQATWHEEPLLTFGLTAIPERRHVDGVAAWGVRTLQTFLDTQMCLRCSRVCDERHVPCTWRTKHVCAAPLPSSVLQFRTRSWRQVVMLPIWSSQRLPFVSQAKNVVQPWHLFRSLIITLSIFPATLVRRPASHNSCNNCGGEGTTTFSFSRAWWETCVPSAAAAFHTPSQSNRVDQWCVTAFYWSQEIISLHPAIFLATRFASPRRSNASALLSGPLISDRIILGSLRSVKDCHSPCSPAPWVRSLWLFQDFPTWAQFSPRAFEGCTCCARRLQQVLMRRRPYPPVDSVCQHLLDLRQEQDSNFESRPWWWCSRIMHGNIIFYAFCNKCWLSWCTLYCVACGGQVVCWHGWWWRQKDYGRSALLDSRCIVPRKSTKDSPEVPRILHMTASKPTGHTKHKTLPIPQGWRLTLHVVQRAHFDQQQRLAPD